MRHTYCCTNISLHLFNRKSTLFNSYAILTGLRKNSVNTKGTGGGKGEELTGPEQIVLDHMKIKGSDLVQGITGGFESIIPSIDSTPALEVSNDS